MWKKHKSMSDFHLVFWDKTSYKISSFKHYLLEKRMIKGTFRPREPWFQIFMLHIWLIFFFSNFTLFLSTWKGIQIVKNIWSPARCILIYPIQRKTSQFLLLLLLLLFILEILEQTPIDVAINICWS